MLPALRVLLPVAILAATIAAQPVVGPPNYSVTPVPGSVFVTNQITSMAVDVRNTIFLVDEGGIGGGGSIHRVRPGGAIDQNWMSGLGNPGQLAYNPFDGFCYVVDTSPILPVISARVYRLEASGPLLLGNIPVVAFGLTFLNDGTMIVGGMGISGPGLYSADALTNSATFLTTGHGQNAILQSLASDDVLIADGGVVRRWTPGTLAPVPYYSAPPSMPNNPISVTSLARRPFNQAGAGGMVGVRDFTTLCQCGVGYAMSLGLNGGSTSAAPFASESFNVPFEGLGLIASGVRQNLCWMTTVLGFAGRTTMIHVIEQVPAVGSHGSLLVTNAPGSITLDLYGAPSGGDPFLLGFVTQPFSVGGGLFVPGFGVVDLDPFAPNYIPLIDGLGAFGPPNPLGMIPPGGHWSLSVTVPVLPPFQLNFLGQANILDYAAAPNGLFTITNLLPVSVP